MKVLVCIPCLLTGGTEIQTLSLVEALVAAGHKVMTVCYFEHSPLMVERYRKAGSEVRLLSPDGIRTTGVKNTFGLLWRGLRRARHDFHPDVAHVQYMAPGALPILILKALGQRKIIATTHTPGDIYSTNGLRIIRLLTRHVLTAFQCITELAEKSYFGTSRMFDGTLSRHFTIYNNIPSHISILSAPRRPKVHGEIMTIGVVSRLEHIKGMDLVVPAFAVAAEKNPQLRLLIIGDGSQRELMERQVWESGLDRQVEFLGRKPQSELQSCYDRIDILLMPSRSEGFGLTAIEGMARGCVPVVANVGGLPEVVTPDCGLLHRPEDISDLAKQIVKISSESEKLSLLSKNAITRALIFSATSYKDSIAKLYKSL